MKTDIEISKQTHIKDIREIAAILDIKEDELELYGKYKAKINNTVYKRVQGKENGKLVLVTAINPTPAGEGKTTVTIGLGQALNKIGKSAIVSLREPSLGPVFGLKGGATGGGYSQVVPMEDINLHFTGDMHAITSANNLLCALVDNHIQQGNSLKIDQRKILVKRCLDMNDRALRNVVLGLGGKANGIPREEHFTITVASEVMAILCLAKDVEDLKYRLGNILLAYSYEGEPVYARDLNAQGAMAALLKDAINPNLVQTLEGTPAIIHGGPFANIAHGCNSIRATKLALKLADYCVTEAGFGSDLGAEKFFDIKCRISKLKPSAVVLVATLRALKYNGGVKVNDLSEENIEALKKGIVNLSAHIDNLKNFGIPIVVALNRFLTDTDKEVDYIRKYCNERNIEFSLVEAYEKGGAGAIDLAGIVSRICDKSYRLNFTYEDDIEIEEKIEAIARKVYGASGVNFTKKAENSLRQIKMIADKSMPICIAKTQYSLSDNPALLGRPKDFIINVKDVTLCNGAGFIVVLTGDIMTMPGLPKNPAAYSIDIDKEYSIKGLF